MPTQDPDVPVPSPTGWPRFTQRLFSEECGIAEAGEAVDPFRKDPGYEWSNGRKFDAGPGAAG